MHENPVSNTQDLPLKITNRVFPTAQRGLKFKWTVSHLRKLRMQRSWEEVMLCWYRTSQRAGRGCEAPTSCTSTRAARASRLHPPEVSPAKPQSSNLEETEHYILLKSMKLNKLGFVRDYWLL